MGMLFIIISSNPRHWFPPVRGLFFCPKLGIALPKQLVFLFQELILLLHSLEFLCFFSNFFIFQMDGLPSIPLLPISFQFLLFLVSSFCFFLRFFPLCNPAIIAIFYADKTIPTIIICIRYFQSTYFTMLYHAVPSLPYCGWKVRFDSVLIPCFDTNVPQNHSHFPDREVLHFSVKSSSAYPVSYTHLRAHET